MNCSYRNANNLNWVIYTLKISFLCFSNISTAFIDHYSMKYAP